MKKSLLIACFFIVSLIALPNVFAGKTACNTDADSAKLVNGIKNLDPAIVAVRPAHVIENSQPVFKVQWNPAVTLKKDTPIELQKTIAKKVADFVVKFQGGVLTDGVYGGMLAFLEGEDWHPQIGQVAYKVDFNNQSKVEVVADLNIINEDGSVSCCDEGEVIGYVVGNKFVEKKSSK